MNPDECANGNSPEAVEAMLDLLIENLRPLRRLIVAYSGGVDSTVVMAAAVRALGTENVIAVTALSETLPERELQEAAELAQMLGITHRVIETRELDAEEFQANSPDRCYHCKSELWSRIREMAADEGFENLADGVNFSDSADFRPGIKAGDEAGVIHPLVSVGAGKTEVRAMAKSLGLSNWDKPSQACLSSRFPYGDRITADGLKRVEAAEEILHELGLGRFRVRIHGEIARIEVPGSDIEKLASAGTRKNIVSALKGLGYAYITLDLEGFRSGSMNETLATGLKKK
ncbi:MAG: ATP-dependent sacrificial sulfur transferase LarE [Thermoleophilia bacterium]|nr:ATP-dependent sacrificial sulfur transferase LarE [Thermoleophilia bacterium]